MPLIENLKTALIYLCFIASLNQCITISEYVASIKKQNRIFFGLNCAIKVIIFFVNILQAKDNDIAIGVYKEPFPSGSETPRTRKKKEEDMSKLDQLTPVIRSQCHVCPEVGCTVLWFTGNSKQIIKKYAFHKILCNKLGSSHIFVTF